MKLSRPGTGQAEDHERIGNVLFQYLRMILQIFLKAQPIDQKTHDGALKAKGTHIGEIELSCRALAQLGQRLGEWIVPKIAQAGFATRLRHCTVDGELLRVIKLSVALKHRFAPFSFAAAAARGR